jgi:hypothetical protein
MRLRLTRDHGMNKQELLGKKLKDGKVYSNVELSDLCVMGKDQVLVDREYYKDVVIRNYFTTEFKKQFKVHREGDKLCFLRDGHMVPLLPGKYGFIVSPKGGLYAVYHQNGPDCKEIQNADFFHSLIRAGQPVQSAGFFVYDAGTGEITEIFRDSGHYKPNFERHLKTCLGLVLTGLLTIQTRIGKYSDEPAPLTFTLYDVVNKRVDFSAIVVDGRTMAVGPPPTSMAAQSSVTKPLFGLYHDHDGYGDHHAHDRQVVRRADSMRSAGGAGAGTGAGWDEVIATEAYDKVDLSSSPLTKKSFTASAAHLVDIGDARPVVDIAAKHRLMLATLGTSARAPHLVVDIGDIDLEDVSVSSIP